VDRGHRQVYIVDEERNPFELWVVGALFLSSFLFIIGAAPPPSSVEATVKDEFWRWAWYIQILIGTIFVLFCSFFLNNYPIVRKYLTIGGYVQIASGTFVYAGAVFFFAGAAGTGAGTIIGFIGVACIFRILQIQRQVKNLLDKYKEWSE
jgi:hypothetical protein